ncbi:MAG: long-chain fatty acid--CoA ligase [Arachnia propionica]|nr:MAG: long-chain fatty acid--CoA ligase [Arachnia propionica]
MNTSQIDYHVGKALAQVAAQYPDRVATRVRIPGTDDSHTQTYAEFEHQVRQVATRLMSWDVQAGDRVAIFARNSPQWSAADYGCLYSRAVPVPIYQTSTPDQVAHVIGDSGAETAFIGGPEELAPLVEAWDRLPNLKRVVSFAPVEDERVMSWDEFLDVGDTLTHRLDEADPDDLYTLSYTSGTTGDPKGAMLVHRGMIAQWKVIDAFFEIGPDDDALCFLPLSHSLQRAWTVCIFSCGATNTYVADPKTVADQLVWAKPTLLASVPRLFEKIYTVAHEKVTGSPLKRKIFEWAFRVGGRCQRAYRKGKTPTLFWRAQLGIADRLVLKNIRDALGGRSRVLAAGGAPLRREVEEFFSAAGLLVCQGYGLTEASPLVSFNCPGAFKFGTVGRPIVGCEIKIADHGEIWYKGPNVMRGYWNQPEATAEVLSDGWLHTGDVGYVDTDGYLVITDRLKDIIVTQNGKNIAPQAIEGLILADPLFEYAVVLGDNRPFLTLLVRPSLPQLEELADSLQVHASNVQELFENQQVLEAVRQRVAAATERLASYEQVKDLRLMWEEFTMDNGLLTPTLKVKRREVEKRFGQIVDDMYAKLAELRARGERPDK